MKVSDYILWGGVLLLAALSRISFICKDLRRVRPPPRSVSVYAATLYDKLTKL
jgi:hypothetical protein